MGKIKNTSRSNLKNLPKQQRGQRYATPLNRAAIGREGLEVYDGGWIRILNGGLQVIGTATISGTLAVTGQANFSGQVGISGPLDVTGTTTVAGNFEIIAGGLFKSGSVEIRPDGSAKYGTLEISPDGTLKSGLFELRPDGSAKFGGLNIDADGTLVTGKTKIETNGRAEFGNLIIDPDSLYFLQTPGGWLSGSGADDITLASSATSSVSLNSDRAELSFGSSYVRVQAARTYVSNWLDVAGQGHIRQNLYSYATTTLSGAVIASGLTNNSAAANVHIDANGRLWRSTSASRFKVDQQVMELPKTLLDPVMKDWVDAGSKERFDRLDKAQRPFTFEENLDYESVDLRRIPGMVAEDVASAGGEQFVTYDETGLVNGFAYDRYALARTQLLVEWARSLETRIVTLEGKQ